MIESARCGADEHVRQSRWQRASGKTVSARERRGQKFALGGKIFPTFFRVGFLCDRRAFISRKTKRSALDFALAFSIARSALRGPAPSAQRVQLALRRQVTHVNVNVADVRNVAVYGVMKRIAFWFAARHNRCT